MNGADSNSAKRVLIWLCALAVLLTGVTIAVVAVAYRPARELLASFGRPGFAAITPIDLTTFYDKSASWNNPGAWEVVPHGSNVLGGVPFEVNGLLRLTGLNAEKNNSNYRDKVEGIPVGKAFARLHLLHLAGAAGESDRPYARIVLHYEDGSKTSFPLEYGRHARYWHRSRYEYPSALSDPNSKVVWRGEHESTPKTLRIFKTTFENPKPDVEVASIDLVSEFATANAVILAMSIGPANVPRPQDDPPSLPEPEEPLDGQLKFTAVDAESGKPLPNVRLRVSGSESGGSFRLAEVVTDKKGEAIIKHPGDTTVSLTISTIGDGVPQTAIRLPASNEEPVPVEYTFKAPRALTIGGVIQDEAGQPVPGATLRFMQYGAIEAKSNERVSIGLTTNQTDAAGHWEFRSLPRGFTDFAIAVAHPDYAEARVINDAMTRNYGGEKIPFAKLTQTNAVIRLRKGVSLTGRVLDKNGEPIPGAKVLVGETRFSSDANVARTDDEGVFKVHGLAEGPSTVTVQANNHAPEMRRITLAAANAPVEFKLEEGHVFKARVLDEFNTPVRTARITVDRWQGKQTLDLSGTTDTRGRVTIRSAPRDGMTGSVYKSGYMQSYNVALVADGEEKTLVLRKSATITGTVLDAETKEPIDAFEVYRGQNWGDGRTYWQDFNAVKGRFGQFSISLTDPNITALRAEADGYVPGSVSISNNFTAPVTFELKKGNGPKGIVLLPDGTPAAGAQIAVVTSGSSLSMGKTRFQNNGERKVVKTDAAGAFSLPRAEPDGEKLIVLHTNGYAELAYSNFVSGNTITLSQWGTIEGELLISDQPGTNQSVLLTPDPNAGGRFWYEYNDYMVVTDDRGKFVISNVPPGERRVVRLIRIDERSQAHSPLGNVLVKPGEVAHVKFGGDGTLVTGQLASADPARAVDWRNSGHHTLSSYPKPPPFKSQEEYRTWLKLPETIEAQKKARYYTVQVDERGAFRVEDVLPGDYDLQFYFVNTPAGNQQIIGSFRTNVVVAARVPGAKMPRIDLGRIEIRLNDNAVRRGPAPQAKANADK